MRQVNPNLAKTVSHDQAGFAPGFCSPRPYTGKLDMWIHILEVGDLGPVALTAFPLKYR